MNHVTIGDGCSIQGSVICSNVQLQERVVLKDCQVINLSFSLSFACLRLASNCYTALHFRLVQAVWLMLTLRAKGRPFIGSE